MDVYTAIYNRHMTRDFQDKEVPAEVLTKIISAGMQAPSHDHLRNWEFIILRTKEEKENALQFIAEGVKPQLEILKRTLVEGTSQKKMYDDAMPKQYTMLFNASHVILPFFKSDPEVMHPTSVSSLNPLSSIWCVIQNIFLAATAEGLACSMRIPVDDEGIKVAKAVGAPEDYLLPCYIGLGYPSENRTLVEQVHHEATEKMHFGKW